MAEEGSKLQRMDATHGVKPETGIPEPPPGRPEDEDTKSCVKLLEQLKEMHNKYKNIVDKIKSGEGQLFLIKCGTSKGNYHFLAKYKSDNYKKYFQGEQSVFNVGMVPDPCSKDKLNKFKTYEKMEAYYNEIPPHLFFTVLHEKGKEDKQLKLAPKYFKYDDFKNSIIPINEAFMYEEMQNEIISDSIIGYNSEIQDIPTSGPAVPPLPPGMERKDTDGDELNPMNSEEFQDVNEEDGTKVVDIEGKTTQAGGRKKRKKQRSRSKKRRRRRKNRTKKN